MVFDDDVSDLIMFIALGVGLDLVMFIALSVGGAGCLNDDSST